MKNHMKVFFLYDTSYKTFTGAKPLRIRFDKLDEFIRVYDETRYLVLFGPEKYDAVYDRIKYFISKKIAVTYVICYYKACIVCH